MADSRNLSELRRILINFVNSVFREYEGEEDNQSRRGGRASTQRGRVVNPQIDRRTKEGRRRAGEKA